MYVCNVIYYKTRVTVFSASIHPSILSPLEPIPAAPRRRRGYILDLQRNSFATVHIHTITPVPAVPGRRRSHTMSCGQFRLPLGLACMFSDQRYPARTQGGMEPATFPLWGDSANNGMAALFAIFSNSVVRLIVIHIFRASTPLLRRTSTARQLMNLNEAPGHT